MSWYCTCIGNSAGSVRPERAVDLDEANGTEAVVLSSDAPAVVSVAEASSGAPADFVIDSERGKLGDSEDSFLFVYTAVDPASEGFRMEALFEVLDTKGVTDWQSGYGLAAADTAVSTGKDCRFRNLAVCGRFRITSAVKQEAGMRIVSGQTSSDGKDNGSERKLDTSRRFIKADLEPRISGGESIRLSMEKTDEGIYCAFITDEGTRDELVFPGCDFLTMQDRDKIYVGFMAAGNLRVRVSETLFERTEGILSHTPADELVTCIPGYPFDPSEFNPGAAGNKAAPISSGSGKLKFHTFYTAPDGKRGASGTADDPMDLEEAIMSAAEGSEIILKAGVYSPKHPIYIPEDAGGSYFRKIRIRAEESRGAVIDGSGIPGGFPMFILRGHHWALEGLVFRNSPSAGLFICGSNNDVIDCEAEQNRDTGILICTFPGTGKKNWPSGNTVADSDSHDNRDVAEKNADGFGAKLSVGPGNKFIRCTAYRNADDGFDLYNKKVLGPGGAVMLTECTAFRNGKYASKGKTIPKGMSPTQGVGFKLGGENVPVRHQAVRCSAFLNDRAGFSTNSNPAARMYSLLSHQNGKNGKTGFMLSSYRDGVKPEWIVRDLVPESGIRIRIGETTVNGMPKGGYSKIAENPAERPEAGTAAECDEGSEADK